MSSVPPFLLEVCEPQVIDFHCGDYELNHDLHWLDQLRPQGAVVAVILHSCRILEALARHTVGQDDSLETNINLLRTNHQMPRRLGNYLHELRWLGNDARHARRPLNEADADLAYLFVLHWLAWYFCEYHRGLRLPGLLIYNQPLEPLLPARLAALVRQLDTAALDDPHFVESLDLTADNSQILLSPVVPALLVESLLHRGRHESAWLLLDAARRRFPGNLRLRQLLGLYYSRIDDLENARLVLERVRRTRATADEETLGILAGVYKRCWQRQPESGDWLARGHTTYLEGWELSKHNNTYLGINAATTALWLGKPEQACALAKAVLELLRVRQEQLSQVSAEPVELGFWDQVTLAEGELLLGRTVEALAAYEVAFTRFPEQTENIRVSREQAREIAKYMGIDLGDSGSVW